MSEDIKYLCSHINSYSGKMAKFFIVILSHKIVLSHKTLDI